MKTTAVEFLLDNFHYYYSQKWNEILEQAKEIEKKQIIDAYEDGNYENGMGRCEAEQYYNETYRK